MSHHNDLDAESLCRCRDHTEALVEEIDYGALWLEYGIVSDLVVSPTHLFSLAIEIQAFLAFYKRFSSRRHP